jgi:hypothetical protein
MTTTELTSLSLVERKEYEELKLKQSLESRQKKDRAVFLGYFVIALISTLLISGALDLSLFK